MNSENVKFKFLVTLLLCLLSGYAISQKKIPFVNNIKQYNIKKGDVSQLRIEVYAAKDENGQVTKGNLIDYPVEITFDEQGNRIKEIIYETTGKVKHTNIWDYNVKTETVGQYQLDTFNRQIAKKLIESNAKQKNVRIKRYGTSDTLLIEEFWMVGASGKTINTDKYVWDTKREIIGKKTTRSYNIKEGKSIEFLISELSDFEDYMWYPDFMKIWQNAQKRKTRTEKLNDGSKNVLEYRRRSRTLMAKKQFDPEGKVTQNISYNYEFDNKGNWIKLTQHINDKPVIIVTRDITYRTKK